MNDAQTRDFFHVFLMSFVLLHRRQDYIDIKGNAVVTIKVLSRQNSPKYIANKRAANVAQSKQIDHIRIAVDTTYTASIIP